MPDRRNFLRGLVSLPLIGGSLAILGQPTAAAVPVTDALQLRYLAWLAHEHLAAVKEHMFRSALAHALRHPERYPSPAAFARRQLEEGDRSPYTGWFPDAPDVERLVSASRSSTRAAVILSAAGVPLTGGAHG